MLRINGFDCNVCIHGLTAQLSKLTGVKDVQLWMADGMIAINGSHINLNEIKHLVQVSSYEYQGLWSCPTTTANLGLCKRIG
jgi:copper chaperone CopZ